MVTPFVDRIDVYRYLLLVSTLLNAFGFAYCFVKMNIKTLLLTKRKRNRTLQLVDKSRIIIAAKKVTKAILNIVLTMMLLITSLFVTITSEIALHPYFMFNTTVGYSMCFLLAVCLFNLVLKMETDALCLRNFHEIPMFMVMALLATTVLVKQENAMAGIICHIMSGSLFSDELYNVLCCCNVTRATPNSKKYRRNFLVFRIAMHILCNFGFPIVMFFVPSWFTEERFFQMHISSIIIFFLSVMFLFICNVWRFTGLLQDFFEVDRSIEQPLKQGSPKVSEFPLNLSSNIEKILKDYIMNASNTKSSLLEEYKALATSEKAPITNSKSEYKALTTPGENKTLTTRENNLYVPFTNSKGECKAPNAPGENKTLTTRENNLSVPFTNSKGEYKAPTTQGENKTLTTRDKTRSVPFTNSTSEYKAHDLKGDIVKTVIRTHDGYIVIKELSRLDKQCNDKNKVCNIV